MDVLRTFPKLRTLMDQRIGVKNAASSMRSCKISGIPGSTRGPFAFWECFNLTVWWEAKWKVFENSVSLFLSGIPPYQLNSAMQLKILQGNHLPMTALSKQLMRHFVFKDARNRSSEFIQWHEDVVRRSFHAGLNLWSFHFCSFQFNEVLEKLRFLLHASQKNIEAFVWKKHGNLGFYWKKRYGVLSFLWTKHVKHAN